MFFIHFYELFNASLILNYSYMLKDETIYTRVIDCIQCNSANKLRNLGGYYFSLPKLLYRSFIDVREMLYK